MTSDPGAVIGGALLLLPKIGGKRKLRKKGTQPLETRNVKRKTKDNVSAARKVLGVTCILISEMWVCVFTDTSGCIDRY
jgi:hypothetical protein